MIANAARLSANEAGAYRFTDVGSIPAWARGSVGAVVAAGYMTGYPDGSFYANAYGKYKLQGDDHRNHTQRLYLQRHTDRRGDRNRTPAG